MATQRLLFVFLLSIIFVFFPVAAMADDISLLKSCVDRSPLVPPSSPCGHLGLPFLVDITSGGNGTLFTNCTLSSGNLSEFFVPEGVQQLFLLPPSAPVGQNRIRCNVTKTTFIEKPFTVHGAILDAVVDAPSVVYMNSTIDLKVMSVDYDWQNDAPPGFSACWNLRDPSSGQVIAQWVCSNATTTYPVPASLPIGPSQFVLLLQAQNYESFFKYVPVTVRSSPTFSSSIYPESQIVQVSGGRLEYVVSVRAVSSADLTASWSDGRVTLDGKQSSVSLHVDSGKNEKFNIAFDVPATTGCEIDCPQQKFSITLTDQYGNSQKLTGVATVTNRYTSSFSISPESLGKVVVPPGSQNQIELLLTNTGKLADVYSAVLMGDAVPYSSISPATMTLAAGSVGKYTVTILGSSSLPSGPMQACFSSRNQPSVQTCVNATTVGLGFEARPVSLSVQPVTLAMSLGDSGAIDVVAVSSITDAGVSGTVESNCAEWLSNTEWVTTPRTISGRYTNKIHVKPLEVGTCIVKITLRVQGAPALQSATATAIITSSLPEMEIDAMTRLSEDILSNVTLLQSKINILKNAGVDAAFINGLKQNATLLAEKCVDDVSNEQYSAARTSCGLAQSGLKTISEVVDYGGRSIRASKPSHISPITIASAILIAFSAVYLVMVAPM